MAVDPKDLAQYADKRIVLIRDNGEGKDATELEGVATKANELGIIIKEKGKANVELIEAHEIIEVRERPEEIKPLAAKTLKPVLLGQARSHLLERHALTLDEVNKLTENAAFEQHQGIDHKAAGLGHVHEDKAQTPAAQAVAQAEQA